MIKNVKSDSNGYFIVGTKTAMDSSWVLIKIRINKKGYKEYYSNDSDASSSMDGNYWTYFYIKKL